MDVKWGNIAAPVEGLGATPGLPEEPFLGAAGVSWSSTARQEQAPDPSQAQSEPSTDLTGLGAGAQLVFIVH